jgi:hypothetical protein
MIGSEDDSKRSIDPREWTSLPSGDPDGEVVEMSKRSGGSQYVVGSTSSGGS